MSRNKLLFFVLALVALAIPALAQEMPPAKELVMGRRLFIAFGKEARAELKITDEQLKKIVDAFDGALTVEEDRIMIMNDGTLDMNASEKRGLKVLDEDQVRRLNGLWIQRMGAITIADDEIAKTLELSDTQKKSATELVEKAGKALAEIFGEGHDESVAKKAEAIREEHSAKALELLDEKQKKKLEELKGKPFKFKKPGS